MKRVSRISFGRQKIEKLVDYTDSSRQYPFNGLKSSCFRNPMLNDRKTDKVTTTIVSHMCVDGINRQDVISN